MVALGFSAGLPYFLIFDTLSAGYRRSWMLVCQGLIMLGHIKPSALREAVEWVARLAILVAGALILRSGLAANAGVLANVLRSLGASGAADAVLAAWKSNARVWVHLAAVLVGFAVIVVATLPLPGARTPPV